MDEKGIIRLACIFTTKVTTFRNFSQRFLLELMGLLQQSVT